MSTARKVDSTRCRHDSTVLSTRVKQFGQFPRVELGQFTRAKRKQFTSVELGQLTRVELGQLLVVAVQVDRPQQLLKQPDARSSSLKHKARATRGEIY